jgi:hypothetical protein
MDDNDYNYTIYRSFDKTFAIDQQTTLNFPPKFGTMIINSNSKHLVVQGDWHMPHVFLVSTLINARKPFLVSVLNNDILCGLQKFLANLHKHPICGLHKHFTNLHKC